MSATDAAQPIAGDASGVLLAGRTRWGGHAGGSGTDRAAAYGVSEAFGWKWGLDLKLSCSAICGVIVAATGIDGIGFVGMNFVTASSAPPSSTVAGAAILLMVMLVSNRKVMGERTTVGY